VPTRCSGAAERRHAAIDVPADEHAVAQCITYRGRVSALLGRGVVELDGRVSLLLAHCQLIDQGLGVRVGALIVAHNVHVIEERERVRALGVCALSRIEVLRHSPLTTPFVPPSRKSSPALYLQPQQCVGFARFLWLFDVQRSLTRKFPRLAVTDAILWGDADLRERGGLLRCSTRCMYRQRAPVVHRVSRSRPRLLARRARRRA
jgi:hypothetical protein